MPFPRIRRLLAFPRRNSSASRRWEYIGWDRHDAYRMMDGSSSEADLRRRGARMANLLVSALDIRSGHRILDVGCGMARVGRELAPRCGRYHGVDISRRLLELARIRTAHLANVELTHLPGPGLDGLPSTHYDRVICHLVLLHLDDAGVRRLFSAFTRVLRAEGAVYFDLWNVRDPHAWDLFRKEALDARIRRQPHRSRFYTRESVEAWLPEAGLDAVWVSGDTFLIQVVAVRKDAGPGARRALADRLASEGPALLPRGRLEFDPGPESSQGLVPPQ